MQSRCQVSLLTCPSLLLLSWEGFTAAFLFLMITADGMVEGLCASLRLVPSGLCVSLPQSVEGTIMSALYASLWGVRCLAVS